jgi:hypothetical protein
MRPVANAHSTQRGEGRRCHQGHHLPRDQKGSAVGLQAARRKLRHLPRRAAASVSIGGASLGRRDAAKRRHLPVSGLGRELVSDPEKWAPVFGQDHAQTKNALSRKVGTGFRTRSRANKSGSVSFTVTLRREHRRQVYAACASLAACEPRRATARIPLRVGGRLSFEARPLAGHLRMTDNER